MARPRSLWLHDPNQRWRTVPMPGADQDLELVPLEVDGDGFTILGRFPVGFSRTRHGGYLAAEDVLVLDGGLELDGRAYGPGTLIHIPARHPRTSMHAPRGCLVLAWFTAAAIFRRPDELGPGTTDRLRSIGTNEAGDGLLLATEVSHWSAVLAADRPSGADAVDGELTMWTRSGADWPAAAPERLVVRTPAG